MAKYGDDGWVYTSPGVRMRPTYEDLREQREIAWRAQMDAYEREMRTLGRAAWVFFGMMVAGIVSALTQLWVWATQGLPEKVGVAWGWTAAVVGVLGFVCLGITAIIMSETREPRRGY